MKKLQQTTKTHNYNKQPPNIPTTTPHNNNTKTKTKTKTKQNTKQNKTKKIKNKKEITK